LIDVAASGANVVEREGLSIRHPAKFVLVGSGNPEEGELRPQLLDRFGLAVEVKTPQEPKARVEIIKRRDEFERNQTKFMEIWEKEDDVIRHQIQAGKKKLPTR
jgi:magnesium chelatase subunit I